MSVAVAAAWLVNTPLFGEPDEQAHLDYALTLAHRGWPVAALNRRAATDVDPLLRYFERVVRYRELRFDTSAKVAADYGSPTWRLRVDGEAPPDAQAPDPGKFPFAARDYPAGFYLIGAGLYRLSRFFGFGSFESILVARALGVLTLPLTLLIAFGVFRRDGAARKSALVATAVIGIFPLTSWTSATFQPDTLTTALVAAALLLAMRARERPGKIAVHLAFGVVCGSVAFVKLHYALVAYAALLPAIASGVIRRPSRKRWLALVLAAAVPAAFLAASAAVMPRVPRESATLSFARVLDVRSWLVELRAIYFFGNPHFTFWTRRDWPDTSFFPSQQLGPVEALLSFGSLFLIALVTLRIGRNFSALRRIATRHFRAAIALAFGDAVLNLYVLWTAALIAIDVSSAGTLGLLGRHWLPVLIPLVALTMRYAGRRGSVRGRRKVATTVALTWLAYAAFAAPFAFGQTVQRFSGPASDRLRTDAYVTLESIYIAGTATMLRPTNITLKRGDRLCLRGLAIDSRFGLPARGVALRVDNTVHPLRYGIPRDGPENIYQDEVLRDIGFDGCLSTTAFAPGSHDARLIVTARDLAPLLWPGHLNLIVTENPRSSV